MDTKSLPIKIVHTDKKTSSLLISVVQSTLLLFLLFFPVTFISMFLHEAGHALFNLTHGVPVDFLYVHPFSFSGYFRPMADYYKIWQHASGPVFELLVSVVIFALLWKHRSFYTLPFLMVFPWVALSEGIGCLFDILVHSGDEYNIMLITGWSATGFYVISIILIMAGIFSFITLLPLLGLVPEDKKTLFVLPAGMLLYTAVGLPIAYFLVPGSPIDVRYHLAHEIIMSTYYQPLLMVSTGLLLAVIYITLYRMFYKRLPINIRTELASLSWRDFWYPGLLFIISVILGLIIIL